MKLLKTKYCFLVLTLLASSFMIKAQETEARQLIVNISYNLPSDKIPFLKISATEKVERMFIPQKNIEASIYLSEESPSGLLGKIKTDSKGESKVYMPASFKEIWDSINPLKFIAVTEATKDFESVTSEIDILKSRIEIDTSSDDESKNIAVKLYEFKDGEWIAAQETEIRVVVKRLLGNLAVGDEETYTTDSNGVVNAEFIRDSLPGDQNGQLTLLARTDESDLYGNISTEITVPWGIPPEIKNDYNKRSLWARQFKSPVWLLALAYSIIGGVWGMLIYLIIQLFKIRKLGKISG